MADIEYDPVAKVFSRPRNPNALENWGMGEFIWKHMKQHSNRIAQIDVLTGEKDLYADLLLRSVRTAMEMKKLGIKPKDIVTICSHNHLNSAVPYIAAHFIGAIPASTDPSISKDDNQYLLNKVKPKIIFVNEDYENPMRDVVTNFKHDCSVIVFGKSKNSFRSFDEFLAPKVNEDSFESVKTTDANATAIIFFSSGTTGSPKGITVSHNFMVYNMTNFNTFQGADNVLGYASLYWISTNMFLLRAVYQGSARILCHCFDPNLFWTYVTKYDIEMAFLAPSQAIRCLKVAPMTIRTKLKHILVGGSPISPVYLKALRNYLPHTHVSVGFGQSEIWVVSFYTKDHVRFLNKFESSGFPLPGYTFRFVDVSTEEPVGFNQPGEIRIKAPYIMNGYYNQDSSDCWDKDGFFRTGDVGYYDEDFCFFITDRIKEMFKYISWHIVPAKLEAVLDSHPSVSLSAVVGIPHSEDDNHAMGIVVLNKGSTITAEGIENFVNERVDDRHKLRAGVRIIDAMPYTPTGKIKRRELRDMVINGLL